ncbi:hypothetical protein IC575_008489 [Cucumis melo]
MRRGWGKLDFINRIIVDESSNETCTDRLIRYIFHIDRSTFMFLLYEYDIFWPEKLLSYESGIEPMGDAWVQFRIRYYMFALVFVVFDVEKVFLYPWAMSFDVLGVSVFIEALIFVLILIVGLVYAWRKGAMEWS